MSLLHDYFPVNSLSGYKIPFAARLNGSTSYGTFTPATKGNTRKLIISGWIRKHKPIIGADNWFFTAGASAGSSWLLGNPYGVNPQTYGVGNDYVGMLSTANALQKDSQWQHFCAKFDTAQVVAADRFTLTLNGVLTETNVSIAQNEETAFFDAVFHFIGRYIGGGTQYVAMDIAELYMITDQDLTASDFGEFNNEAWEPAKFTGTLGPLDRYYNFSNPANLGEDSSGNGLDMTVYDFEQIAATPTDVYARLNPLKPYRGTLSQGNTKHTVSAGGDVAYSDLLLPDQCYVEAEISSTSVGSGNWCVGVAEANKADVWPTYLSAVPAHMWLYRDDGYLMNNFSAGTSTTAMTTNGQRLAIKRDGSDLYFGLVPAGGGAITWLNGGSPVFSGLPANLLLCSNFQGTAGTPASIWHTHPDDWIATDAPSGFGAVAASNLPPVTGELADHFVHDLQTENTIEASLAALHSFTDTATILRNTTTSEAWIIRFSHDAANEYTWATGSAYAAKQTLAGSDLFYGEVNNIAASSGTAAGSVAHTSGAATTVTHNLNNERCVILAFGRTNGGTGAFYGHVQVHHPDLTNGYNLLLTSANGESSVDYITNVTANSFDISASANSDTVDYLVMGETAFRAIFAYTGNGLSDGACPTLNMSIVTGWFKNKDAGVTSWEVIAQPLSPNNTVDKLMVGNGSSTSTYSTGDWWFGGFKQRNTNGDFNTNNQRYIGWGYGIPVSPEYMPRGR